MASASPSITANTIALSPLSYAGTLNGCAGEACNQQLRQPDAVFSFLAADEATMLQVVKPVAKAIFKCVDDVILPYKVRGEVASAILQLTCEEYLNCAGKNMGKKATKEGRSEVILCLKKYVEEHLPPDLPTGDQHQPRELVAPMLVHGNIAI
nr:uncharacterized protein LOC119159726 [Rhipicephalus microplus]